MKAQHHTVVMAELLERNICDLHQMVEYFSNSHLRHIAEVKPWLYIHCMREAAANELMERKLFGKVKREL